MLDGGGALERRLRHPGRIAEPFAKAAAEAAAAAHAQHAMQPAWLGDAALHESHQSKLLEKNEDHYRAFFKGVTKGLPYVWPIMKS